MSEVASTLRIGQILPTISRFSGGLLNAARFSTIAMASAGHRPIVFGLCDQMSADDLEAWKPIRPKVFQQRWRRFNYSPSLGAALIRELPDLIHQHGLWVYPSVAVSRFRKITGHPTIISPHGMLDPWALGNKSWKKRIALALFERRNLQTASCLQALNLKEALSIRALGISTPIATIPNGVSLPAEDGTLKHEWLSDHLDDRQVMLFLGRIHHKKGLVETVRAWHMLKKNVPHVARNWQFVIAGWDDGGEAATIRKLIEDLNLAGDVKIIGAVFGAEKDALLRSAKAFILASYSEGLPISVLEAWSYRVPVFMTNECNIQEGFAAGGAIEITTSPRHIAKVLADHLAESKLQEYGHAGYQLVLDRFTWSRVVQNLLHVYKWLVFGGATPSCVDTVG